MDTKEEYQLEDVTTSPDNVTVSVGGSKIDPQDERYKAIERRLVRKYDYRLMPCFWLMFFFTNIARANIGSAIIMNKSVGHDLQTIAKMTGSQVSLGVALFYVGLVVFELPSNLIITKVSASKWLARIMVTWGIISAIMVVIKNVAAYYVLRFLLGVMEAGLWPGMAVLMSKFYKKEETATRVGFYFFAGALASVFTGFFAAAFQLIDGRGHLYGYQWLFLVFGLVTIIVGVFVYFVLPSTPFEKKNWLTEEEKEVARHRLISSIDTDSNAQTKITFAAVLKEMLDYKVYLFTICYMTTVLMNASMQYYSQTIIVQMGYTSINASLMSIPVGVLVCISAVIVTNISDRVKSRSYPYITFALISACGFAIVAFAGPNGGRYAGLCIIGFGIGPGAPLSTSWALNSKDGEISIAVTTGIVSGLAQLGLVFSTFFLYTGWSADAPRYVGSNSVNIGIACLGAITAIVLRLDLQRLNRQIERHGKTSSGHTRKYLL
ncbi:major facilitator superfamily domain-containing protein [Umbelopsis sp. PMI_123]|nr:major facilitator superfamily domain-containing protein [Umbelopsis sp. PMI_123]